MVQSIPLNKAIPECASYELNTESNTISFIFRTKTASEIFDMTFIGAWELDEKLKKHCSIFKPDGFDSWRAYAESLGVPQMAKFAVAFDDTFTPEVLAAKITALFEGVSER